MMYRLCFFILRLSVLFWFWGGYGCLCACVCVYLIKLNSLRSDIIYTYLHFPQTNPKVSLTIRRDREKVSPPPSTKPSENGDLQGRPSSSPPHPIHPSRTELSLLLCPFSQVRPSEKEKG